MELAFIKPIAFSIALIDIEKVRCYRIFCSHLSFTENEINNFLHLGCIRTIKWRRQLLVLYKGPIWACLRLTLAVSVFATRWAAEIEHVPRRFWGIKTALNICAIKWWRQLLVFYKGPVRGCLWLIQTIVTFPRLPLNTESRLKMHSLTYTSIEEGNLAYTNASVIVFIVQVVVWWQEIGFICRAKSVSLNEISRNDRVMPKGATTAIVPYNGK